MQIRPLHVIGCAALVLGVLLLTFWFGFRQGVEVALTVDAVPRGGMSLFQLKKLEEGDGSTNMRTLLESDVDIALMAAHKLDHHPLLAVLESLSGLSLPQKESLIRLANYRKSHPSPLRAEAIASETVGATAATLADRASLLGAARETEAIISLSVNRYASPKPAN